MLERAKIRALPVLNQASESAPMVTACCNACRSCITTNLVGLAIAGVSAVAIKAHRFTRRFAGLSG